MKIDKLIFNNSQELSDDSYNRNLEHANALYESYTMSSAKIKEGDFVLKKDGTLERVTVAHSDGDIQLGGTSGHYGFHIGFDGDVSYSGSCGDLMSKENLTLDSRIEIGRVWFFNVDTGPRAHSGIHFDMPTRVWKEN